MTRATTPVRGGEGWQEQSSAGAGTTRVYAERHESGTRGCRLSRRSERSDASPCALVGCTGYSVVCHTQNKSHTSLDYKQNSSISFQRCLKKSCIYSIQRLHNKSWVIGYTQLVLHVQYILTHVLFVIMINLHNLNSVNFIILPLFSWVWNHEPSNYILL